MPVRKAVIPAAGLGTRFLPVSKAVPKVLLPVVDRPIIQYAVEELARAGVSEICVVISHGQGAIADYFSSAPELEASLERTGKTEMLAQLRALEELAEIFFVQQRHALGLGHAVGCARDFVGDEPFVVLLPDEMFDPADDFLAQMIAAFDGYGLSVIAGMQVAHERICNYGAIDAQDLSADPLLIRSVVEKPPIEEAPSDLAIVGRYLLEPEVFDILSKLKPGAVGEIQLTDALDVLAHAGRLLGKSYPGRRWDVGNIYGWLQANHDLAADDPRYAAAVGAAAAVG